MDHQKFTRAYMNVVLHLSESDPVMAQYYLSKFPKSLPKDKKFDTTIRKNLNNWFPNVVVEKGPWTGSAMDYNTFVDALNDLARAYLSGQLPYNEDRARMYIRWLKILGDNRYKQLTRQFNNLRKK